MKERIMQEAIATVLRNAIEWPQGATVLVEEAGDLESSVQEALQKPGVCVVVGEPDQMRSVYGATTFIESSTWIIRVYTGEGMNTTGLSNLEICFLVRTLLADANPEGLWAEPLSRCRVNLVGKTDGIVARDVVFTAAYQS